MREVSQIVQNKIVRLLAKKKNKSQISLFKNMVYLTILWSVQKHEVVT